MRKSNIRLSCMSDTKSDKQYTVVDYRSKDGTHTNSCYSKWHFGKQNNFPDIAHNRKSFVSLTFVQRRSYCKLHNCQSAPTHHQEDSEYGVNTTRNCPNYTKRTSTSSKFHHCDKPIDTLYCIQHKSLRYFTSTMRSLYCCRKRMFGCCWAKMCTRGRIWGRGCLECLRLCFRWNRQRNLSGRGNRFVIW